LPLTLIETIQSLVLYNRTGSFNNTTIGLAIELYNSTQDPNLTEVLATTSAITTAVNVYRFDFPDIGSYTGFATGESLSNIIREEDATSEVVSVAGSPTEMQGGLSVDTITLPTIGDAETNIQSNTNNLSSIQTQVDSLIDIFSQGISFRAYSLSSATISSGQKLPFNNESYDSQGTYDTTTYIYTIDIAGTYLFTFGWYVVEGIIATINLIRKRSGTEVIIQLSTTGSNTGNNTSFIVATIAECESGDEIYANIQTGSCRLAISDLTEPDNNTSFSGSRISS